MTKNEPLQSRRLIFKVLSIGLFLFCAALLGKTVFAWSPDLDSFAYDGKSFDLSGSIGSNILPIFSADGSKIFIPGNTPYPNHSRIWKWNLTTPWDVSTITGSSDYFEPGTPYTEAYSGGWITADGHDFYVVYAQGSPTSEVRHYHFSTAYSPSTASYVNNYHFIGGASGAGGYGLYFSSDGHFFWSLDPANIIYQFYLSTAWDISTAVYYGKQFYFGARTDNFWFGADGLKLYRQDRVGNIVYQYNLSVAWDVSTAVDSGKSISVGGTTGNIYGVSFSTDNTKMYFSGGTDGTTQYQYSSSQHPPATPTSTPLSLEVYGIKIDPVWYCCDGQCGQPISALPQLSWWGIGSSTLNRIVLYQIDTGSATSIDLTNQSSADVRIATSTTFGNHLLSVMYFENSVNVASGTSTIEIVAGPACINPSDTLINFCVRPCKGIASTTSAWPPSDWHVGGDIECAGRKIGCWLLQTPTSSIVYFQNQLKKVPTSFPLSGVSSIYSDLTSSFNASSSGIYQSGHIGVAVPVYLSSTSTYDHQFTSQDYSLYSTSTDNFWQRKIKPWSIMINWIVFAAAPCSAIVVGTILFL